MSNELDFLNKPTRYIYLLTYASEQHICEALEKHESSIRACAWIVHDKDVDKNGELKPTHKHVLVVTHYARTPQSLINWFTKLSDQNTFAEPVKTTLKQTYAYLTHENDSNKYLYSSELIHHINVEFWDKISCDDTIENNVALRIIDDLIQTVPYYEMVKRYGRDFVINYDKYLSMAQRIRLDIDYIRDCEALE